MKTGHYILNYFSLPFHKNNIFFSFSTFLQHSSSLHPASNTHLLFFLLLPPFFVPSPEPCARLPAFTSLGNFLTPRFLSSGAQFFPYHSIKHSFYPLLSDVSPSTSIHLLLSPSLPFPSLSPPDYPTTTTTTSLALTAVHSIFLHMRFA